MSLVMSLVMSLLIYVMYPLRNMIDISGGFD